MLTLQSAFRKRLRKVKPGTYPSKPEHATSKYPRSGSITISPNPRPKPKPQTFGGSLGEQERESSTYGAAASQPRGGQPIPGPSRKISGHKDAQGSTKHHGGAGAGSTMPGARQTPGGVRIPEHMVTPKRGDYRYPDKPQHHARGGNFKKVPADNPYAGGHKNVEAAVMKAVRAVGGK